MSDALLIVSAFWIWWGVDAVRWSRRPRALATRGGGAGWLTDSRWRLRAPLPWQWSVERAEPTVTFSPEGLSNRVLGSAQRPSPVPEVAAWYRWEDVTSIAEKAGVIWVNGKPFCEASAALDARRLALEVERFRTLSPKGRELRARRLTIRPFAVDKPGRAWRRFERATRPLAVAATVSAALWSGSTVLFGARLGLWADPLPAGVPAARALLFAIAASAAAHLATLVCGWLAHRRLAPTAASQRRALLFNVALVPAQALRLRTHLAQLQPVPLAHSLVWVRLFASRPTLVTAAENAVRDLEYPTGGAPDPILAWSLPHQRRLLHLWLQRASPKGVCPLPQALLAPPPRQSQRSCLYCPRCHSQFETEQARCPHGITLKPFDVSR